MADKTTPALAKASCDRCCQAPDFVPNFYRTFLAACPEAAPMFAETDFERQDKLLRHAIGLLLIFPNQPHTNPHCSAALPSGTAAATSMSTPSCTVRSSTA